MFLIAQITFAIVLAHYIIQWPRLREADRQAKNERCAVDREIARDTARHARNAAAKAALEPELAQLDPHTRTMFLIAWESGETVLTSESLAAFVQRRLEGER